MNIWSIIPRLTDQDVVEFAMDTIHVSSLINCAVKCQQKSSCRTFQYNGLTEMCNFYQQENCRATGSGIGNKFFQLMPQHCVSGLDEWFPEIQKCIWLPPTTLNYYDANTTCQSVSKTLISMETPAKFQFVKDLMNMMGYFWIHLYARRERENSYSWKSGSPITQNWCPGQPDGDSPCVGLDMKLDAWCPVGGLDDIICSDTRHFFCE
ncbi:collectin-12-like [Saccostrea echinata]|uniref:collectin-12-like n=1 Tax=Saccostrea echinata TaxID=191078 RepID=UPI002A7F0DDA|nr:collectin-12-like [Saccostrea echinata]